MKFRLPIFLFVACLSLFAVGWIGFQPVAIIHKTSAPNPKIDARHYEFHLTLNDANDSIYGEAKVNLRFRTGYVSAFTLDLVNRDKASGQGMIVSEVLLDSVAMKFEHTHNQLWIEMPFVANANDNRTFTIRYKGIPADGLIISKNKFGERTFFGDNWPDRAHNWLPVVDHPADKATVEFIVIAPSAYQVIGNGQLVEEGAFDKNNNLTHWRSDVPLPTKVMVIGAARFSIHHEADYEGIPVQSWVFPQNRKEGFHDYAPGRDVLQYFSEKIGPYPYEKLANVQSKTRYGGMENASCIFYFENSVNGKGQVDKLIAHEVAHQWFGNSASEQEWAHIWLSEGFATYFAELYMEHAFGIDTFLTGMQENREMVTRFAKAYPDWAVVDTGFKDLNQLLNPNVYQKGAWILHMLRVKIGDEAWWQGIRTYYDTYKNGNALTGDFQAVMENASGKDLDGFFRQWLYSPGHPVLKGYWNYNEERKELLVYLENKTPLPEGAVQPIEVAIRQGNSEQIETLKLTETHNSFVFQDQNAPDTLILDPDMKLLFEADFRNKK